MADTKGSKMELVSMNQGAQPLAEKKPLTPEQTVKAYLDKMAPEIAMALPKNGLTPERLGRVALTAIKTNPLLMKCSIVSLMASVIQAAQLGLEPGMMGQCYFVPYGDKAQFIIGYRGLIELARRSGNIESIAAHTVYEKDLFEFEFGLDEKLRHIPALSEDRGQAKYFYAYAKFKGGGHQIEVMTKAEVDAIRKRSKAGNNGPWISDYEEMAKKTVVRRMAKYLPLTTEIFRAVAQDETVKTEINPDMTESPNIIEGEFTTEEQPATEIPASEMFPKGEANA